MLLKYDGLSAPNSIKVNNIFGKIVPKKCKPIKLSNYQ